LGARILADMGEGRGSTGSPTARHVWQALDVGLDSFAFDFVESLISHQEERARAEVGQVFQNGT
jgi:hypothetical protein